MVKVIAFVFGFLGCVLAVFFLFYGVKGGFVDKSILRDFSGNYATGKDAVQRGILYIFFGLFFLLGTIIVFLSLYKKMS